MRSRYVSHMEAVSCRSSVRVAFGCWVANVQIQIAGQTKLSPGLRLVTDAIAGEQGT
jgi:hypothetical protein